MPRPTDRWKKRRERLESDAAAYGGQHPGLSHMHLARPRGLKGLDSYGAAGPARTLGADERKAIEDKMRKDGRL